MGWEKYNIFLNWVAQDIQGNQASIRKRYSNVLIWCMLVPLVSQVFSAVARYYGVHSIEVIFDALFLVAPIMFSIVFFVKGFKSLPIVVMRGGALGVIDQAKDDADWAITKAGQLVSLVQFTEEDKKQMRFAFDMFIRRQRTQNWYFAVMAAVTLFFVSFFIDYSAAGFSQGINEANVTIDSSIVMNWVQDFSSWGVQVMGILMISALIYLIGVQQVYQIERYRLLLN